MKSSTKYKLQSKLIEGSGKQMFHVVTGDSDQKFWELPPKTEIAKYPLMDEAMFKKNIVDAGWKEVDTDGDTILYKNDNEEGELCIYWVSLNPPNSGLNKDLFQKMLDKGCTDEYFENMTGYVIERILDMGINDSSLEPVIDDWVMDHDMPTS